MTEMAEIKGGLMKLRGDARPDKILAEYGHCRKEIANPWIEENRLIATDGRHLVCYQVDLEEGESPARLPVDSRIFTDQDRNPEDPYVLAIQPDGGIRAQDQGLTFDRPEQTEFVDYKQVCVDLTGPGQVLVSVALDPSLLVNILEAQGRKEEMNPRVELVFEVQADAGQDENFPKRLVNKQSPVIVNTVYDGEHDFSLIMPCRMVEPRFGKIELVAELGKGHQPDPKG